MAAYSAVLRGAAEVYVVDRVPERLEMARNIGCIPVDLSQGNPAAKIIALRGGWVSVYLFLYGTTPPYESRTAKKSIVALTVCAAILISASLVC